MVALLILSLASSCTRGTDQDDRIEALVSIQPQAYFVEKVGGTHVAVSVLVGKGQDPYSYEPSAQQIVESASGRIYFAAGIPCEEGWIKRIVEANPEMQIVDMRRGIRLLPSRNHGDEGDAEGFKDPHIWLSPRLVKTQAKTICEALTAADPANEDYYTRNLKAFQADLDNLDMEILGTLLYVKERGFMAFRPVWGYFANDFGLTQVPVEKGEKGPSAEDLAKIANAAKEKGVRTVLIQKTFGKKDAEALARATGGKVVQVDPFAGEYVANMKRIGRELRKALR